MLFRVVLFSVAFVICSKSLGVRYGEEVGVHIVCDDKIVSEEFFKEVPAYFTITDGKIIRCWHIGFDVVSCPVNMFEEGICQMHLGKDLVPIKNGRREYKIEGYETVLDNTGVNHLCLSAIFGRMFATRKGIKRCVMGCRTYFDEEQALKLGEGASSALENIEVFVVPESICGLVYKTTHISDNCTLYDLVVTMSGKKTVFSFYRMEISDGRRNFENLFHIDFDLISDHVIQEIIYKHIRQQLNECIRSMANISEEHKHVTFYPRTSDLEEVTEFKIDMRQVFKELLKAFSNGRVISSVKIVEGVYVLREDGNAVFVIEAPVIDVGEIQRELSELLSGNEVEIREIIERIKGSIVEKTGDAGCMYSVFLKSKFTENPILCDLLDEFGRRDSIIPEYIEQGAAIIGKKEYNIVDSRAWSVSSVDRNSGVLFAEEVELRNEIRNILIEKGERTLSEVFEEVSDSSIEIAEILFSEISDLKSIRVAIEKWRSLKEKDGYVKNERKYRQTALKNLEDTISSIEKSGKEVQDVWLTGLRDVVSKARDLFEKMNENLQCRKDEIENVEFDLIIEKKRLFRVYYDEKEAKIKEEQKKAAEISPDIEEKSKELETDGLEDNNNVVEEEKNAEDPLLADEGFKKEKIEL